MLVPVGEIRLAVEPSTINRPCAGQIQKQSPRLKLCFYEEGVYEKQVPFAFSAALTFMRSLNQ